MKYFVTVFAQHTARALHENVAQFLEHQPFKNRQKGLVEKLMLFLLYFLNFPTVFSVIPTCPPDYEWSDKYKRCLRWFPGPDAHRTFPDAQKLCVDTGGL